MDVPLTRAEIEGCAERLVADRGPLAPFKATAMIAFMRDAGDELGVDIWESICKESSKMLAENCSGQDRLQ